MRLEPSVVSISDAKRRAVHVFVEFSDDTATLLMTMKMKMIDATAHASPDTMVRRHAENLQELRRNHAAGP